MDELETQLLQIPEGEGETEDRLHKGLRILAQIIARQIRRAQEGDKQDPTDSSDPPNKEA